MDPVSALGLGANILQFIDLGIDIVKQTRLVLKAGALPEFEYFSIVARDIEAVVEELKRLSTSSTVSVSNEGGVAPLIALGQQCQDEAYNLVSRIDSYNPSKRAGLIGKLSTFRKVVQSYWDKSEIESLEKRLDGYRSQLSLRMLAALNSKSNKHEADIVEVLSLTRYIYASLGEAKAALKNKSKSNRTVIEPVGAVLKAEDGSLRTILNHTHRLQDDALLSDRTTCIKTAQYPDPGHEGVSFMQTDFQDITDKILNTLWFRQVGSRERGIQEAFHNTYEWIFKRHTQATPLWADFSVWLREGSGCYWINGKAGSGKSTLMKYVANHQLLWKHLKLWAGRDNVLMATFFFWRAGQELQRSQEGLLRSLLYQTLVKRPELVAVCFPDLYRALGQSKTYEQDLYIDFEELKLAFSRLLKQQIPGTKVFFLIDGLDEYRGDYRSLCSLVLEAGSTGSTKCLVSSRPLPHLVQAFNAHPSLDLRYLTIDDIRYYATENLIHDSILQEKERSYQGLSLQLIDSIVARASGVFLWVVLVVKKVLEGLAQYDYDSNEEVLKALEGLPDDLDQLYAYMFNQMGPEYRKEASFMLQLYIKSEEVQFHFPMTALQLDFALTKDVKDCLGDRSQPLKIQEIIAREQHIEGRLRSRCCGLLEVQRSSWGPADRRKYIGFLHRTVMDFFEREEIWKQLTSWNLVSAIHLSELLLCSCVKEARQNLELADESMLGSSGPAHAISSRDQRSQPDAGTRILHGLVYNWTLCCHDQDRGSLFAEQLWQLYSSFAPEERKRVGSWAQQKVRTPSLDGPLSSDTRSIVYYAAPVLIFAASYGLGDFGGSHIKLGSYEPVEESTMLLNLLVSLNNPPGDRNMDQLASGVFGLLKHGIDPNQIALWYPSIETANEAEEIQAAVRLSPNQENDLVPWIYWLSCKRQKSYIVQHQPQLYMEILERMIAAGATIRGNLGKKRGQKSEQVSVVVEECFELLQATSHESRIVLGHIQQHLKKAGLARSKTWSSEVSSKSEGSRLSWFKGRRRSTNK